VEDETACVARFDKASYAEDDNGDTTYAIRCAPGLDAVQAICVFLVMSKIHDAKPVQVAQDIESDFPKEESDSPRHEYFGMRMPLDVDCVGRRPGSRSKIHDAKPILVAQDTESDLPKKESDSARNDYFGIREPLSNREEHTILYADCVGRRRGSPKAAACA
jgi:hypothetical protein